MRSQSGSTESKFSMGRGTSQTPYFAAISLHSQHLHRRAAQSAGPNQLEAKSHLSRLTEELTDGVTDGPPVPVGMCCPLGENFSTRTFRRSFRTALDSGQKHIFQLALKYNF
jgi:hypothetical protein